MPEASTDLIDTTKIGKPGIYDIPMDDYHQDCCVGPSVSSSGLRTIEAKSPAHYYAYSYLNPNRAVKEESAVFNFGKAGHALTIEGVSLEEKYHVLPKGFSKAATLKQADAIASKAAAEAEGKISIKHDKVEQILAMRDALEAHPYASAAFNNGRSEPSIIWQHKSGIWLKARPDFLPKKINKIPDYKCHADARKGPFARDLYNFGYLQQAALIIDGLAAVGRKTTGFYWVVQEKEPPYAIAIYVPTAYDLAWGRIQNDKAIEIFAHCVKSGEWPGYPDKPQTINLPAWGETELSTAEAAGKYNLESEDDQKA